MGRIKVVGRDIVHRWEGNPLIDIEDIDFMCADVRNAGVAIYEGEVVLLVTIMDLVGTQHIHLARQVHWERFVVSRDPFLVPSDEPAFAQHECKGLMDARITQFDSTYYIVYVAHGDHGFRLGMARTDDFKSVERIGLVSLPDTKGGALFPEKIGGRYVRIERPGEGRSLWVSRSDDLIHWGSTERVLSPRGGYWDANWVGVGPPPLAIDEGWLIIYYGAKSTSSGPIYRLGAAVVGRDDPTKVLHRSNVPILAPREYYERIGDLPNIVFTTGCRREGDDLFLYYGAANRCICLGKTSIRQVVDNCKASQEVFDV